MSNIVDKHLKNLAVSLIWTFNVAVSGVNHANFEQSWLQGILGGVLIFALLSLIEDEEWHMLLISILGSIGSMVLLIFACAIVMIALLL